MAKSKAAKKSTGNKQEASQDQVHVEKRTRLVRPIENTPVRAFPKSQQVRSNTSKAPKGGRR